MPVNFEIPHCTCKTKLWPGHEYVPLKAYAHNLLAKCYFDLQASNMVLAQDKSSCRDDHLCPIILKSHHAGQSYGLDRSVCHYSICTKAMCAV